MAVPATAASGEEDEMVPAVVGCPLGRPGVPGSPPPKPSPFPMGKVEVLSLLMASTGTVPQGSLEGHELPMVPILATEVTSAFEAAAMVVVWLLVCPDCGCVPPGVCFLGIYRTPLVIPSPCS